MSFRKSPRVQPKSPSGTSSLELADMAWPGEFVIFLIKEVGFPSTDQGLQVYWSSLKSMGLLSLYENWQRKKMGESSGSQTRCHNGYCPQLLVATIVQGE